MLTHSEANSDLDRFINQKFDAIIDNTNKKVCKSRQLNKLDKYWQTSYEDSFKLKYLELKNTKIATEIIFWGIRYKKKHIMRSLFMLKSVKHDKDDFYQTSRNMKNTVDNVNKNATPSSANKSNINSDKSANDSIIQST